MQSVTDFSLPPRIWRVKEFHEYLVQIMREVKPRGRVPQGPF